MTKKYNKTIIILALCSVFTDFLINTPANIFYPRDRIIHIIISAVIFTVTAHMVNAVNFKIDILKFIAIVALTIRLICFVYKFSEYFRKFYGNNTANIIVFTIIVFVMVFKINKKNISQLGAFYIIANFMVLILFAADLKKVGIVNLYSVNADFNFNFSKLTIFFDIFTISIVSEDKISKWKNQKSFIFISTAVFAAITLFQGFCIKGDLLYSLSPLQSVLQILSGNTIKRYDYVFNLFFTFNYFGAIILYSIAVKKLVNTEKCIEKD